MIDARDMDGAQFIKDLEEADRLLQKDPNKREKRGIYNVQLVKTLHLF